MEACNLQREYFKKQVRDLFLNRLPGIETNQFFVDQKTADSGIQKREKSEEYFLKTKQAVLFSSRSISFFCE